MLSTPEGDLWILEGGLPQPTRVRHVKRSGAESVYLCK